MKELYSDYRTGRKRCAYYNISTKVKHAPPPPPPPGTPIGQFLNYESSCLSTDEKGKRLEQIPSFLVTYSLCWATYFSLIL